VVVNYRRSAEAAKALVARLGVKTVALQGDVTQRADMDRLVGEAKTYFGRPITTVVNNALGDYRSQHIGASSPAVRF
jgi:3-oxoacyl-[acyl-carrier protein] reductase